MTWHSNALMWFSRGLGIVGPFAFFILSIFIMYGIYSSPVMVSFSGETYRIEIFNAVGQGSRNINIRNSYLCVPRIFSASIPEGLGGGGDRDGINICNQAGLNEKIYVELPERASISLVDHSNIRVQFGDLNGKSRDVVFQSMGPLEAAGDRCATSTDALPTVVPSGGNVKPFKLAMGLELHAPANSDLVIPFEGDVKIGGDVSADYNSILANGAISILRSVGDSLNKVKDLELYPGDLVSFNDTSGCGVPSKGFAHVVKQDDVAIFGVVASALTPGAFASIKRDRPNPGDGKILFGMNFVDALLADPLLNVLAGGITAFVILKESLGLISSSKEVGSAKQLPHSRRKSLGLYKKRRNRRRNI